MKSLHMRRVKRAGPAVQVDRRIHGQMCTTINQCETTMTDAFKAGDKVEWHSPQGAVQGTIKKKLTAQTSIKGHAVAASKEHPEYLVVSDKTGAEAAHKESALKKL
jgi:hypothetical protein